MDITNGAWVVVCDAGKYLLLQNIGSEDQIDLRIIDHAEHELSATRELGTDRPGTFTGFATRRGGPEPTDWHRLSKEDRIDELAEKLNRLAEAGKFRTLVVISDKRSLGLLRDAFSHRTLQALEAEIGADYAHHTLEEIEALITRH